MEWCGTIQIPTRCFLQESRDTDPVVVQFWKDDLFNGEIDSNHARKTGIPNGTGRESHVWLCGPFTTHNTRAVNFRFFFCPNLSFFHPFPRHSFPRTKRFFPLPKKQTQVKKQEETAEILSSTGVVKDTRPVWSLSLDYHTSVTELKTNDLLKSTITDETHPKMYGDFFTV